MKTALLFGIHCHQPIDNFDYVIDDAIEKSYKPFFEILAKFPEFKISVHFSGSLLEYIENNNKPLFTLMKNLCHQIEFFTGGFYEPVLASIPAKDRIAQVNKLNKYIKKHFNQTPKGLWLTERVWDNSIISELKECGIEYAIVDDYHLRTSGADLDTLNGYFTTEDSGEQMGIFPINQDLRYAIPFYSLEKTNAILHEFQGDEGKNAAIIFDDGEKFGIWPKTYETVYEKKWLEDFIIQTLEDSTIEVQTFKEFYKQNKPIALAYLPTVSYFEMGEWSLNHKDGLKLENIINEHPEFNKFLRGSTWKNFFTKYQESNWIHKRALELSNKQLKTKYYKECLYKAQCNDVLWHGVFGGIYLPNLRDNAYKYIIECEKQLDEFHDIIDIDMNGEKEYKYKNETLLSIISTQQGGQVFELDLLKKNFNLLNTLTRYEEVYHKKIEQKEYIQEDDTVTKIVDEEGEITTIHENTLCVEQSISLDYDWYFKKSAIDHIVSPNITIEEFAKNIFKEFGDFANQPFEVLRTTKRKLFLKRDGGIYDPLKRATSLEKSFSLQKNGMQINLSLQNGCDTYSYLHEWNLHFASIEDVNFNGVSLDGKEQYSMIEVASDKLIIKDKYLKQTFIFKCPNVSRIFLSTLSSISQSEKGVDITNQGVSIGFLYNVGDTFETSLTLKVEKLDNSII